MPPVKDPAPSGEQLMPCPHCDGRGHVRVRGWMRARRLHAKLSLKAMAAECACSAVYLSDIELGKRPGNPFIHAMYNALPKPRVSR